LVASPGELVDLAERSTPGSLVTFCFEGFSESRVDDNPAEAILGIAAMDHDAVILARTRSLELRVEYVSNGSELHDFLADLAPEDCIIFGRFPDAGNYSLGAVTMTLPDDDGVTRPHPY
jgi:hypothetical protein